MATAAEDKKQIGLTLAGSQALTTVMDARVVAIESDAYRLAIAYALGAGMDPESVRNMRLSDEVQRGRRY